MNEPAICCKNAKGVAVATPFTQIIALGFYDGRTSGLACCGTCGTAYRFDMLDWDEEHEARVFRLAVLPPGEFDRAVEILSASESPRWPVWVPFARTKPAPHDLELIDGQVQEILASAAISELLVCWTADGLRQLAARRFGPAALAGVPDWFSRDGETMERDWFGLLGLAKVKAG